MLIGDSEGKRRRFAFDHAFDELNDQASVWATLKDSLLGSAVDGFNVSLFAYGQTGSGKSHTMFGSREERGLIPRFCAELFERIGVLEAAVSVGQGGVQARVEHVVTVSMIEIYCERLRDLLTPYSPKPKQLRVRDSPSTGSYVEGSRTVQCASAAQLMAVMRQGARNRTVAATAMNEQSSRAHTVVTVRVAQHALGDDPREEDAANTNAPPPAPQPQPPRGGATLRKSSIVSLVDLAGSERAARTEATGDRLQESGYINKSLATLALVISTLAAQNSGSGGGVSTWAATQRKHVPYRDSVLTHLLKDSLGGNARTTMLAAVSPASDSWSETLSTLRYAESAKRIQNSAVVNKVEPSGRDQRPTTGTRFAIPLVF